MSTSKTSEELRSLLVEEYGFKEQDPVFIKMMADLNLFVETAISKAEIRGMQRAKPRVLRRTEIPKGAKNPTKDAVVILGEQIAEIIDVDIAQLNHEKPGEEEV